MKKTLLTFGTLATAIAPIATVISCGTEDKKEGNGIFTEYVRGHDLSLSLGVEPEWHARSDLGSTHDLTNEGYLDEFAPNTLNGKRYNGGDREYFATLGIKLFIAREIDDTKGKLTDVKDIYAVKNSDFESWKTEISRLATKFDSIWPNKNYNQKAIDVIDSFDARNTILQKAIDDYIKNTKTIILVRGDDDSQKVFSGVIPQAHIQQLYESDKLSFPTYDATKIQLKGSGTIPPKPYLIAGKSSTAPNNDLVEAFKKKADYVVYLQTPKSDLTKNQILNNNSLKQMLKTGGKIIPAKYDYWYLPFRGAAIGANVAIDNIYKDILNKSVSNTDWKNQFITKD